MRIINRNQDHIQINLLGILQVCWENILVIILSALLCGGIVFGGAHLFLTPQYSANITMYVNNFKTSDSTTTITTSDLTASAKLVDTYAAIISSRNVLDVVVQETQVDYDIETLVSKLDIASVNNTEVFQVSVTDPDPEIAAAIANAIADVVPEKISSFVKGSSAEIIDYALVPEKPVSPDYVKCAEGGLLAGLLLSAAFFIIRELLNTTVQNASDLRGWDVPILGIVPEFGSASKEEYSVYQYKRG